MVQPLWRTVWRFLQKLKLELPYDPAIPTLGICPEKTIIQKDTCTPMFIATLFKITRTWKQLKCPSTEEWGFPGGAVVENLPANAGDTGSSPGLGRSHMPRSNWAREPQLLSLHVWSLCSATREAAMVRGPRTAMKSGPHLPQLEKALTQNRRPNTAKNKNNK